MWYLEIAEYVGNGDWVMADIMEFDTEAEADDYSAIVNMNLQMNARIGSQKVRNKYFKA